MSVHTYINICAWHASAVAVALSLSLPPSLIFGKRRQSDQRGAEIKGSHCSMATAGSATKDREKLDRC